MTREWPGVLDADVLNPKYVDEVNRFADAAKAGNWTSVFSLLDNGVWLTPNHWRTSGKSWFTPLHQAAWLGAPVDVVQRLIQLGGWRSLRDADGDRPIDIAGRRGHHHLADVLAVRQRSEREQQKFAAWDRHLLDLIAERTRELDFVRFRPVPTEVIAVDQLDSLWFGYPGMYGGFSISIHKDRLFVESWCRVAGGSGQAHVITEKACVLVEEGFV